MPAGQYYVAAFDGTQSAEWFDPAFLEQAAASATMVNLSWGQTTTMDLTLGAGR
jgi:hypothetical protein